MPDSEHQAIVEWFLTQFLLILMEGRNVGLEFVKSIVLAQGDNLRTALVPDLAVNIPIRGKGEAQFSTNNIPELVIEVTSSNINNDLIKKRQLYEQMGVARK